MGLRYATVTGVARDDPSDGGAWPYATTVRAIKELNPSTGVEHLIPDFDGEPSRLAEVFESRPEVFAHNVETVESHRNCGSAYYSEKLPAATLD
jgi:lipoyl synthase